MDVFDVVNRILELSPCAAVRYRIKRMLKQDVEPELFEEFYNSRWVELLKANQHEDGGFGRFHSRDSKLKQTFPTTELAVDSIRMLDIPRGNPLVDKLCDYMEKLLAGEAVWPDGFEKNRWYRPAQPVFVASKLSAFGSSSKAYMSVFNTWHTILKEAFRDGDYNKDSANRTAKELIGCDIDGSYIDLHSIYLIELFGNMQAELDTELKQNYLKWLHHNGKPVHYTSVILNQGLDNSMSELYRVYLPLSQFSNFRTEFENELHHLLAIRNHEGFWNFGKAFKCQRLSEDWRNPARMSMDHTVMILALFADR